ncbi:MAG: hypothetical protein DMD40_15115 [Gemmatimonadetes bacterium]|nr:MAG: hypothetical protein DMD40_15115 [Gemmatimonadota bacterium]
MSGDVKLHRSARVAAVVGAVGSTALMLYAGRANQHILVTVLFVFWVLAPFVTLAWADRMSVRWSVITQRALHWMTLVITVGSLAIYVHRVLRPPRTTGAFVFVAVPVASCLLAAIAVGVAALLSRRSLPPGSGA